MFNEHAFIARVEAADVDAFADLLQRPTAEEERALRGYFGDDRYKLLHSLALRRDRVAASERATRGNVVVIHGLLGSNLTVESRGGGALTIWPNVSAIAGGQLPRLRLADDGLDDATPGDRVRASSIVKRYYGELLLTLAGSWTTHAFYYDWRKNLDIAADRLHAQLTTWFDERAPVHLVAHGMGGLVARTFIERHPARWKTMWDPGKRKVRPPGTLGGRLIMLSTPNHGSFEIVRTLSGLSPTVQMITRLDLHNAPDDLAGVFASFVTPWQMLPSPWVRPEAEALYDARIWSEDLGSLGSRLAASHKHHDDLRRVVDPRRMISINGGNRPTIDGITDFSALDKRESYTATWDGDGWVPASMSRLIASDGTEVPIIHVDDDHGGLPSNRHVLAALDEVLQTGHSNQFRATPATPTGDSASALLALTDWRTQEDSQFTRLLRRSSSWSVASDATRWNRRSGNGTVEFSRSDAREIENDVIRGVLNSRTGRDATAAATRSRPARIEIRIAPTHIDMFDDATDGSASALPADVISVGLYLGSRPLIETRALDIAISSARPGIQIDAEHPILNESDLLITQFAERGTIRGELGQTFIFDDPRSTRRGDTPGRLIAVVGMGPPGRFGEPELALLARELCWTLGALGKHHLATSLIGIGRGNISPQDATQAFLRGVKYAVTGIADADQRALTRVTIIESDPAIIRQIQMAIQVEQARLRATRRFDIDFTPFTADELVSLEMNYQPREQPVLDDGSAVVSRITVTRKGERVYRFGAITEHAAIPEREIVIDPLLVEQANDGVVAARDHDGQLEEGQVLERILLPAELRGQMYSSAPLVLMVDSAMARIHWEMLVQRALTDSQDGSDQDGLRQFLGTGRGVTRQLRTPFAQPPDPPPPPRRTMRVLVIADPAADHRLPGAEAEGQAVAELFEQFNVVYEQLDNRVAVTSLLGPQEATRKNVMKELLLHSYDVLHFAGHCRYVEGKPDESGWIFSNEQLITASELSRIDRIPNFVFSNCCESGVTPDRSEERSAGLSPSFAEAFFERGVTNFVCTAWPVDDLSAREFALRLYEQLLGLAPADSSRRRYRAVEPSQMHRAMREARLWIADMPGGMGSWGAYQHYGNPYMRFFDPVRMRAASA